MSLTSPGANEPLAVMNRVGMLTVDALRLSAALTPAVVAVALLLLPLRCSSAADRLCCCCTVPCLFPSCSQLQKHVHEVVNSQFES
jgi:hypothetical protein